MSAIFTIETGRKNEALRSLCLPVEKVDGKIKKLIQKMVKTMKKEDGCGLAAPQVGNNIRVVICIIGKKIVPMINPVILSHSQTTNFDDEGCLSIPGEYGKVERWNDIEVEYIDEKNMKIKRSFHMFDARVIQHEIDHLEGVLFVDRMTNDHRLAMEMEKEKSCSL